MDTKSAIILLIALLNFTPIHTTTVNSCESGVVPNVNITNCNEPPCKLHLRTTSTIEMEFRAPCYLENIAPTIEATVAGINVPYPTNQKDACNGITNTPCPIAKNELVRYSYGMYLESFFPQTSFQLKFAIIDKDQQGKEVVCFKLDCQTVRK